MKGAFFYSLRIYVKPFPVRQYFDEAVSWLKYPINYCIHKLKCEKGILYSNSL